MWEPKGEQYKPKHFTSSYGHNFIFCRILPAILILYLSLLLLKSYRSETKVVIFWTTDYFTDQNRAILLTAFTQDALIIFSTSISCANYD